MKHTSNIFSSAMFVLLLILTAKSADTKSATQAADFRVDSSKPYAYLEVDHVGPRKPLRAGESNKGIWLRLKNNCSVAIVVVTIGTPPEIQTTISVMDEVVPNPVGPGGDGVSGGLIIPRGLEEMTDIFQWPNMTEAEVRGAEYTQRKQLQETQSRALPERPYGYNGGYEPGVPTLTAIPPGGQVFFSLPINHVSDKWHFEIPFRFAIPNRGRARAPQSYLAFYEEDLPHNSSESRTLLHGLAPLRVSSDKRHAYD